MLNSSVRKWRSRNQISLSGRRSIFWARHKAVDIWVVLSILLNICWNVCFTNIGSDDTHRVLVGCICCLSSVHRAGHLIVLHNLGCWLFVSHTFRNGHVSHVLYDPLFISQLFHLLSLFLKVLLPLFLINLSLKCLLHGQLL